MPRGKSLDEIVADGEQIVRAWEANPTFALGEVTLAGLRTMIGDLRETRTQTDELRTQLTRLVNDTNGKADELNTVVTRARSGFRAVYGPDSTQYEQAGGTRASERKARAPRKTQTT